MPPKDTFGTILDRRKAGQSVQTQTANHGTKNPNLKNPDKAKLPTFPGDFELLKLTLTSPNRAVGGYIDLKGAWSNLNIYEDIFANSLTGSIQITDSIGLMETVPIIGEETIHIHVRTRGFKRERGSNTTIIPGPFQGSESDGIINLKFRVIKLTDLNKLNDGMISYTLHLVSEEYIINLKWVSHIENWFNGGLQVVLKDGEKVEISRRQAVKFKALMSL